MASMKHFGEKGGMCNISFATLQRKKMKLLEITPDLLKIVEDGEILFIKGNRSEEAVLCSSRQTFGMKRVETSNSVFLVPSSSSQEYNIAGRCIDYYETKPTQGRLDNLRSVIKDLTVQFGETLSKEELLKNVQASEYELDSILRKIGVIETSRGLRILEQREIIRATQTLFNGIIRNGYSLHSLQEDACIALYNSEEGEVMKHVLSMLGQVVSNSWSLDDLKVGQATLRILFSNGNKTMSKDIFVQEWLLITPGATEFDERVLRGLCVEIVDSTNKISKATLHYLPLDDLPADPSVRLEKLFSLKARFGISELIPYFADLVGGPGQPKTVEEILLPRTRIVDGKYSKK